ncbi:MAG: helix-turn-helix domain-containing protein [Acetobacteraceae bacterium]|nr:helix-turn-helix domain-containing protein [Acetobacteraceae bacterium]
MFQEDPEAPLAGADLRAARERLGWALPDVAAMLRIRPSYLEALEAGRLDRLPGNVYALGYLRSYSLALGLDPEQAARRFRSATGVMTGHTRLAFPAPVPERGLPAGALILVGLLLVGGAYAGWYHLSGEGKLPAETVAPVPVRLASLAEQALPGPDGRVPVPAPPPTMPARADDDDQFEPRQAASENPLLAPEPAPPPPPVEITRAMPIPGATATTAIAMPVTPQMRRPEMMTSDSAIVAPLAGDPANPEGTRVMLRFTGDTWVQVKERGGQALVTKVMKAGETFAVPARPNLILNTGNAGRVEVLVDGIPVPAIGGAGAVRKDVPMEPEQLKAGYIVPVTTRR